MQKFVKVVEEKAAGDIMRVQDGVFVAREEPLFLLGVRLTTVPLILFDSMIGGVRCSEAV